MSSRFWITVLGPDAKALGRAYLACESAREASILAFNTASPLFRAGLRSALKDAPPRCGTKTSAASTCLQPCSAARRTGWC